MLCWLNSHMFKMPITSPNALLTTTLNSGIILALFVVEYQCSHFVIRCMCHPAECLVLRDTYLPLHPTCSYVFIRSWKWRRRSNACNTKCNGIRFTNLKMYCDETNSSTATQFVTEHLLNTSSFFFFYKCSTWLPLVMRQTSRQYFN
jgi:hypothetical protein